MICIGHRGARGHEPENTLLSVRTALALGASWIEVDVYAVEGELVVIHDDRLERTTNGSGYVMEHSLESLRALDAGKGERIPTLDEIFDEVGDRAGVIVELKGPGSAAPTCALLDRRFAAGLSRESVIVSSFDHRMLALVREHDRSIRLGALMVGLPVTNAAFAENLGAWSVHPSLDFVDAEFVDDAHRRGLLVYVFTVNHPDDIDRMRRLGVDGVFTDYPDRVG
jgi:glycerophosphoryl diester phosphodiesterase